MQGNLPSWPGAGAVYARLLAHNAKLCANAYRSQREADKRKSFRFAVPADAREIVDALNAGEEEQCKWLLIRHRC